ncbi:SH3 domain-containing protein [Nevskia sp.]|uniref:SH3 domain-containing protein n=1 Tax=Nevskia sp. TaxID=1929292 RepID=UPI0025DD978F|nr:SH3 domain-containing protein [Nevskia sp.]
MLFKAVANPLNLRTGPSKESSLIGELVFGDTIEAEVTTKNHAADYIKGTVQTGQHAGKDGYVRRKWIAQVVGGNSFSTEKRVQAAAIIAKRTQQFDSAVYHLPLSGPSKPTTYKDLAKAGWIDCSGWVFLLAEEILTAYSRTSPAKHLSTMSDSQITKASLATGLIVSGQDITDAHLLPGVMLGIDFAEYSWDRNRALDIDHIVIVGEDATGRFISQSSSSQGGVNRVPLAKWVNSTLPLRNAWRMHAVDLLMAP